MTLHRLQSSRISRRRLPRIGRPGRGVSLVHLLSVALILSAQHATAFVTDQDVYEVPQIPRPGYLMPITDPVFGSTVVRITDAGRPVYNPTGDPSLVGLSWGVETGHGYSSRVSWNADQSLLMLEQGGINNVFLDGETYEPLFRRTAPGRERWHPSDPNLMLFIDSDRSKSPKKKPRRCVGGYEPEFDTITWERCFGGFDEITWSDPGKGKPSLHGNLIPIRARRSSDGHWLAMIYDIEGDSLSNAIDMTPLVDSKPEPDFTMSPLGDVIVVVGDLDGIDNAQIAFDVATGQERWRVMENRSPGHADDVVDENDEQWRVGPASSGEFARSLIKRNFRTGEAVVLLPYKASHVSGRNIFDPVYKVIASYHDPAGSPLYREIVGVCLDGSCFERYAHTHQAADGRYLNESHGSVSPFGDEIVFRSSWDEFDGPIDAYVVDLAGGPPGPGPGPGPDPTTAPSTTITAPADGSSHREGDAITFVGLGSDLEDGDLSASLTWTSNLDAIIGSGASFSASALSVGTHTIAASVTDSGGLGGSDQIRVTVTSATTPTGLEARPYKVRSVEHVALTWSGGAAADVEIVRNGVVIAVVSNSGSYTDMVGEKHGGSYLYRVCSAAAQSCSNSALARFSSRH